jgi:probable rRNA maturation factor
MSESQELGTDLQDRIEVETEIEVQVAPAYAGSVRAADLRQAVEMVLQRAERPGEVTLVVTDEQGIRGLNRDFLGQDEVTDVLAFATQEEVGPFVPAPEAGNYLGDVIVCYPRAAEQAREQGHSIEAELALLAVHGTLHLLGYDHATEQERQAMWAVQDEILGAL